MGSEIQNAAQPPAANHEAAEALRPFWIALAAGWMLLAVAGLLYARAKNIPAWAARPLLAALLLEYPFYLLAGITAARRRLSELLTPNRMAVFLVGSVLAPYFAYSAGAGTFGWGALASLAALAVTFALWYVLLPAVPVADLGFLALVAAVLLRNYFDAIYAAPYKGLPAPILGHLALIHVSALALLELRGSPGTRYGFWPNRAEWISGMRNFLFFVPIGFPLGFALGAIKWGGSEPALWKIGGIFLGILWVVALSEEFFFRGLLQQWMSGWLRSARWGLLVTAVLFGAVHLPFRGFPNWRFAMVAAVAGWFYGRAFNETKSIRASMVTHALVVTLWKTFFA